MGDGYKVTFTNAANLQLKTLNIVVKTEHGHGIVNNYAVLSQQALDGIASGGVFEHATIPHDVMREVGLEPKNDVIYFDPSALAEATTDYFNEIRQGALGVIKRVNVNTDIDTQHQLADTQMESITPVEGYSEIKAVAGFLISDLEAILDNKSVLLDNTDLNGLVIEIENILGDVRAATELVVLGFSLSSEDAGLNYPQQIHNDSHQQAIPGQEL